MPFIDRDVIVESCYVEAIRERSGNKFLQLAKRSYSFLPQVAERARELRMPIASYIRTQFKHMPKAWCLQVFKISYPPLVVLASEKAYQRAHEEAEQRRLNADKT